MSNHRETIIVSAQRAAAVAALAAAFLAFGKLSLYWSTGSLVVALSAWDSSIDVFISLINRKIIRFARQDADAEHPYGHGKAESIAALGQGALITGGALAIVCAGFQSLVQTATGHPTPIEYTWFNVAFFAGAACISILVTLWLRHFGEKYNSPALSADSAHYKSDVITNIGAGIALMAVIFTQNELLDPILAIVFAVYIAWTGLNLLRSSVNDLMDHDVPEDVKRRALDLISKTSNQIIDVHKFRSRRSGHLFFFDFHVTLPTQLNFADVHNIVEKIEQTLQAEFDADVVVHADPDTLPRTAPRDLILNGGRSV